MGKSIRIRTTPNGDDKFLKINLEQDFDFVEILSLKLTQKELYTKFCADYGAIVGRVTVNNGFGVPNAKVSVFVPVSEADAMNPEIYGEYPYETISDLDSDGVRYNLLSANNDTNNECFTPVGSFPNKRGFLDDDDLLDVYCEYYKYTTTTNDAGDYMIFGVPTGAQVMYAEADMSDIGVISQHPYDYIRIGSSQENFDSTTKFRKEDNLDAMNHILNRSPIGVDVQPFWGDEGNCNVMITRRDIDMKVRVIPHAIFIGSIFGDNEESSINFKCNPRKSLGVLDGQAAGTGKIEMIRQTINGGIERFDVKGGQLIDKDGTWAYQVPMNMDYRVTDEYGNLVPTDDPNKGIPTSANVRFRIGMDVTGGEGSLRNRAKYLVPHNPEVVSDVDFEFGSNTSLNSFTKLRWNTIYTVKNHIRRYERTDSPSNAHIRNFVGVKDVDSARGKYTPFPFNRLEIAKDALFNFICALVIALSVIVATINGTIVWIINKIIGIINDIIEFFGGDGLAYIKCITLECNQHLYAPGCLQSHEGCGVLPLGSICVGSTQYNSCFQTDVWCDAGYTHCVAIGLIESLNLLKFDFYNDWVNGTLYAPLFKYETKKEGEGPDRFCERTCGGGGVNNGDPTDPNGFDNDCYKDTYIIDTCIPVNSCSVYTAGSNRTNEGLIEKNGDTLYYSPFSRNLAVKFFATDIVSLGSSVKCHYDGTPFVQDLWIDTTYNMPPLLPEYVVTGTTQQDDLQLVVSGMDSESANMGNSLFIDVNCVNIQARSQQCGNIRRQCELGVGLDDYLVNNQGEWIADPNSEINNEDIDVLFSRNIFAWLNNEDLRLLHPDPTDPTFSCTYDSFPNCGAIIGSDDYNIFRYHNANQGITTNITPKNDDSFYFYFGLNAASTAISKLRDRYFAPCPVISSPNFTVIGNVQDNTNVSSPGNGSIDVTVIGGQGPYNYFWSYPDGTTPSILGENNENGDIEDLEGGVYTLTVVDAGGVSTTTTFIVNDPQQLTCNASGVNLSLDPNTGLLLTDGQLNLLVQGGTLDYDFVWTCTNPAGDGNMTSQTGYETISNLPAGVYTFTVTDGANPPNTCTSTVELLEPQPFTATTQTGDTLCPQIANGFINIFPEGGIQPYSYWVEALPPGMELPDGSYVGYSANTFTNTNLGAGTYEVTVTDSNSTPVSITQNITIEYGTAPIMDWEYDNADPASDIITITVIDPDPHPANPAYPPTLPEYLDLTFTFYVDGDIYTNEISPFTITLPEGDHDIRFSYQGCVSETETVTIQEQ